MVSILKKTENNLQAKKAVKLFASYCFCRSENIELKKNQIPFILDSIFIDIKIVNLNSTKNAKNKRKEKKRHFP